MRTPDWWTFALLSLAAFRSFRLLAKDVILDPIRERVVGLKGWSEGQSIPKTYREKTAEFLLCPWCLGFWLSLGWCLAWQEWPEWTSRVAALFAVSAVVGLIAKLDRDEEE